MNGNQGKNIPNASQLNVSEFRKVFPAKLKMPSFCINKNKKCLNILNCEPCCMYPPTKSQLTTFLLKHINMVEFSEYLLNKMGDLIKKTGK